MVHLCNQTVSDRPTDVQQSPHNNLIYISTELQKVIRCQGCNKGCCMGSKGLDLVISYGEWWGGGGTKERTVTSGQLITELFPDCLKLCFLHFVLRQRGRG